MDADYVFRVRFRLDPEAVRLDPATFETVVRLPAPPPGESGWLFFRDHLWRGEANDEPHLRREAESWLGVPVEAVDFRELRTDDEYLSALRTEIGRDLSRFNAESVREVLHKYLGSSIHVREG